MRQIKKTLYTLCVNDYEPQITALTFPLMRNYADKIEADFYVIKKTSMPAILCELGFHTNKIECERMLTKEWKDKVVNAISSAISVWETIHE